MPPFKPVHRRRFKAGDECPPSSQRASHARQGCAPGHARPGAEAMQKARGRSGRPAALPADGARQARAVPADGLPAPAGLRLNKAIAAAGLCSRRKADELILAGRVCVNDIVESNPARHVLPDDVLAVDGRVLASRQAFFYVLLHKPVQVVCTADDPEGRPTVLDVLPEEYKKIRLYPVGRLDYFSEGLLLLTNDGQLAQRLAHPRHHQPKTYDVLVRGLVPETALHAMRRGMRLAEGEDVLPVDVDTSPLPSGNTRLRMVLRQGLNRQIRRMCRDLGLTILRLRRTAQGVLRLGDLPCGAARPLTAQELDGLRRSVGLPSPATRASGKVERKFCEAAQVGGVLRCRRHP